MANKVLTILMLLAIALPSQGRSEESYVSNPYYADDVIASYEMPITDLDEGYSPEPHSLEVYKAKTSTCRACEVERPGEAYYNSRSIACYTTGLVLGVAVIAGLVAIVVNQSNCAHSH